MSFNWLPLSDRKNIRMPKLILEEFNNQPYGGYYRPDDHLVVVVIPNDHKHFISILAHEFRHVIQRELGMFKYTWDRQAEVSLPDEDYDTAITRYFRSYPEEMDALLYQQKHAKSELSSYWLQHLADPTSRHS